MRKHFIQKAGEWEFMVFKKPAGLVIKRRGDPDINLSKKELEDLWDGKITFAYFTTLPRYMYRKVFLKACEALERYPEKSVFDRIVPEVHVPLRVPERVQYEWDVVTRRTKEMKKGLDKWKKWVEDVEKILQRKKKEGQ